MERGTRLQKWLSWLTALLLLPLLLSTGQVGMMAGPTVAATSGDLIFHATGDLIPGESAAPSYPLFGAEDREVNLRMQVTGSEPVDLVVTDGQGGLAFGGTILDGETLWATFTLRPGDNELQITNQGSANAQYEVWLYELDDIPHSFSGVSLGTGTWRSNIRLHFPAGGLYQFDMGVNDGRYQLIVDGDYMQKTVESSGSVQYYVDAGVHDLYVIPDATLGANWTLAVSGPSAGNDTLPYLRAGGELGGSSNSFDEEWLPVYLVGDQATNLELTLTGASANAMDIHLYGPTGTTPTHSVTGVYGGETVWWSAALAAGLSRVQLVADGSNAGSLAYELTIHERPVVGDDTSAAWAGRSTGMGNHSQVWFEVQTAGLYDFDYGVSAGRYQFVVASNGQIQKTVEADGMVRYYLPAGTHELTVMQHSPSGAEWSMAVTASGEVDDNLPYEKQGGNLGGAGNEFDTEWMPLELAQAASANFRLSLDGDPGDGLTVTLYQGGAAVYTTPVVYGGETFWWTADLVGGVNQMQLQAEGANAGSLQYDLTVATVPPPPAEWRGVAGSGAGHSVVRVLIPSDGTYHVALDASVGFAQVLIDDTTLSAYLPNATLAHAGQFDVLLSAGMHRFEVVQSAAYAVTDWTIGVTTASADGVIAHFTGDLAVGEQVDPQLPLLGSQDKEVNFRLEVPPVGGGGQVNLVITDGGGGVVFGGTALAGETVWGTTVLKPGQNTFTLQNTGANPVSYDLRLYEVDTTPYEWAGDSLGAGAWDSHVKLSFPTEAVYRFDCGLTGGRYQFWVDDEYIEKTVETTGTVQYYVPAGDHLLKVVPDRAMDTTWMLDVTVTGAGTDVLPYAKAGGHLWATAAQFNEEWLPVALAPGASTNFELTLTGPGSDALDVYIYEGMTSNLVYSIAGVYGGETVWWSTDLPPGLSRVKLVADSANTGSLAYALTAYGTPTVSASNPAAWAGVSHGPANNSQLRFQVDAGGLYAFSYDASAGRYQFLVNSDPHIQKTVDATGTVRYYLPAGTHEMKVVQDTTEGAAWSLQIAATGMTHDVWPYEKQGGNLGGVGNDFDMEWMPLELPQAASANFRLSLDGGLSDGLAVTLYEGGVAVYTTPVVFGGETFWWTADLAAGVNRIQLEADGANAGELQYDLAAFRVPTVRYLEPYSWSGVSKGAGGNSEAEVRAPAAGIYHVEVDVLRGFANISISPAAKSLALGPQQSFYEFDVPLDKGGYLFAVRQDDSYITTTWTVTVSMPTQILHYSYLPVVPKESP